MELACPPIKAILHIMAYGDFEGKGGDNPGIRELFTRELAATRSDWYHERLRTQQALDLALWTSHRDAIEKFASSGMPAPDIDLQARLATTLQHLRCVTSDGYLNDLVGTIGADPSMKSGR